MNNKHVIFLFNIFQLLILSLCIYIYTSTMPVVPWYEPLTMGAYLMTFFAMFLQGLVVVYYFLMNKENKILRINLMYSLVNLVMLLVIAFVPDIFNEQLFYDLAYIVVILESILFVVFIYLGVVNLKKVV